MLTYLICITHKDSGEVDTYKPFSYAEAIIAKHDGEEETGEEYLHDIHVIH